MIKITKVEIEENKIKLETSDQYIYTIPMDNDYVKGVVNKAQRENIGTNKDIKFYNKCFDICMWPVWFAMVFVVYGIATKFIFLDLVLICSGLLAGVGLAGAGIFKLVTQKLQDKANNNKHWIELYHYAKGNKNKTNHNKKTYHNSNQYSNEKTDSKQQFVSNEYHYSKHEIIQDETEHTRKR